MTFEQTLVGRDNTIKTQRCLVRRWIRPYFSEINCPSLTQYDCTIIMQQIWIGIHGLQGRTLISLLGLLNRYITFYGGNIDLKPVNKLAKNNIQDSGPKALASFEFEKLIAKCNDPVMKTIILCGVHAGLRKGEVFGLKVQDITPDNCILVQRSYNGPTKSGKSRIVPMTTALGKGLAIQMENKNLEDKIFKTFDPNRKLVKLCELARIRKITFHQLRHSCATNLLNQGCSIRDVQEILGHAKPSTTMDIYWSAIKPKLNTNNYFKGDYNE